MSGDSASQRLQVFTTTTGQQVIFYDRLDTHSARCQPRDIVIVEGDDTDKLREQIALDIRLGMGETSVGAARNMLFEFKGMNQ